VGIFLEKERVQIMARIEQVVAKRDICFRCGQWTEYGTSMIGPCDGSDFRDVRGYIDPLHKWRTVVRLHVVNNDLRYRELVGS
jgi:hypothetical protein